MILFRDSRIFQGRQQSLQEGSAFLLSTMTDRFSASR